MKSFKTFCIGAVASIALAGGASAQTFSPEGPHTLNGTVTVSKGITLTCTMSGTGTVSGGTATITGLSLSGGMLGLCGSITFSGLPYAVTSASTSSITIVDVRAVGVTGNCRGNLTGSFNQSTGQITFNNATIPSDPAGGAPCVVNGTVSTSPAISFTIP
ncbi:hypothetical protein D1610_02785 [Sphingomonas gilva]|uniref:Protein activator of alkane oxidation PraB n=1 Tax=Sphingomonas gilva TaxID=2305907 RepID=A0A396RQZ5_9SPHN|nr:hypothetical protein [Sphingomonas gilva]RHW19067.1 hypothetical protein D1610_02785 [Sphingomonas gilva]